MRGNNVMHCVANPQVIEMYAENSPESYGCPFLFFVANFVLL